MERLVQLHHRRHRLQWAQSPLCLAELSSQLREAARGADAFVGDGYGGGVAAQLGDVQLAAPQSDSALQEREGVVR